MIEIVSSIKHYFLNHFRERIESHVIFPSPTELYLNGYEYVLVNRSISQDNTVPEMQPEKNESVDIVAFHYLDFFVFVFV